MKGLMRTSKGLCFGALIFLSLSPIWGTEYVLKDSIILIDGHTNKSAVRNYLGLYNGEVLDSSDALAKYLEEKGSLLQNLRVIKGYTLDYTVQEIPEGPDWVFILITITDGWTFYPVPMYMYNSSAGHTFLGVIYDTNIFGTLSAFKFKTLLNRQQFLLEVEAEKIRIAGLLWRTAAGYEYLEQAKESETGTDLHFNTKMINFGLGADVPFGKGFYYSFFPFFEYRFDYQFDTGEPDASLRPPGATVGYEHAVGLDLVSWHVNFRKGLKGDITHTVSFSPEASQWVNKLEPGVSGFTFYGPLGVSGRLSGFYWSGLERTGAGEELRGIIDNTLWGNIGAYLNGDLAFRLFEIENIVEFQPKLFVDIGFVKPKTVELSGGCFEYTAGLEGLLFPLFAPGMLIRVGYGFNLRDGTGEFFFDFEEFY